MHANSFRGILLGTLLVPLVMLPPPHALAQQTQVSRYLGVLAYIQDGDIWVKALPNGQAKRLTTDRGNRSPRWSPSDRWLAYRKGDQLWLAHRSGGDARVLNNGGAVGFFGWSPAADTLAYTTATKHLRVARGSGWHERELVAQVASDTDRMVWSPDGTWVVYVDEEWGLSKVSANGGVPRKLYTWGGLAWTRLAAGEQQKLCESGVRVAWCQEDSPRPGEPLLAAWESLGAAATVTPDQVSGVYLSHHRKPRWGER